MEVFSHSPQNVNVLPSATKLIWRMRAYTSVRIPSPTSCSAVKSEKVKATQVSSKPRVVFQHRIYDRLVLEAQPSLEREPELLLLPISPAMEQTESANAMHDYYASLHWSAPVPRMLLKHSSQREPFEEQHMLSVQLNDPPQPPGREKKPDFYANVGDAIRTLREDIPLLFQRELNWDIYREDIVFRDPNISFMGLKNYQLIFWSLRFHGKLFFKKMYVEVTRIWQPEDHQIKMRWKVHAVPRVWWETAGVFDGISTYKLDSDGKIYEHMVDNVQLRDPPITNPLLYGLNFLMRPQIQPQGAGVPCPWLPTAEEAAAMQLLKSDALCEQ